MDTSTCFMAFGLRNRKFLLFLFQHDLYALDFVQLL